jgi:hypothetical protein
VKKGAGPTEATQHRRCVTWNRLRDRRLKPLIETMAKKTEIPGVRPRGLQRARNIRLPE